MGKQSSRIYYKGNDHKDIFFYSESSRDDNGKILQYSRTDFINKMYVGNELVWEKLFPEKFLAVGGVTGIHVYDIEHDIIDIMPFYYDGIRQSSGNKRGMVSGITFIGETLVGSYAAYNASTGGSSYVGFYTTDLLNFRSLNTTYNFLSAYTDKARLMGSGLTYYLVRIEDDSFYNSKAISYSQGTIRPINGKAQYIGIAQYYSGILTIDSYNDDGDVENTRNVTIIAETPITGLTFSFTRHAASIVKVGSSIYTYGTDRYNNSSVLIFGKIIGNNLEFYKLIENCSAIYAIIYYDNEIVLVTGNANSLQIISIKESAIEIVKTFSYNYIPIDFDDGEIVNIQFLNSSATPYPKCTISNNVISTVCSIDGKASTSQKHDVLCNTTIQYQDNSVIADIYFDNPYFSQSDGNHLFKLPNYS